MLDICKFQWFKSYKSKKKLNSPPPLGGGTPGAYCACAETINNRIATLMCENIILSSVLLTRWISSKANTEIRCLECYVLSSELNTCKQDNMNIDHSTADCSQQVSEVQQKWSSNMENIFKKAIKQTLTTNVMRIVLVWMKLFRKVLTIGFYARTTLRFHSFIMLFSV